MIYVRDDIPSVELKKHTFSNKIEAIFVEIHLRKNKFLLVGTYHSTHPDYGLNDNDYFEQIEFALDTYSSYDKFLLAGDFNVQESEPCMQDFLEEFNAKNLVKGNTCFKNINNPSCIDLFITNSCNSFQSTTTISTGLSDFHKMIVTVLKTTFPKAKPKVILYRDFSKYDVSSLGSKLKKEFQTKVVRNYEPFENIFIENIFIDVLDNSAPYKKKVVRANQKPYVTKRLRKAIMKRSNLENKFYKYSSEVNRITFKKQKNYCNRFYKRERRNYYSKLKLNNITDNKKFWNVMKPLISNKGGVEDNIVLVKDEKIISKDTEVAQTFNDFFTNAVSSLDIIENKLLLTETTNTNGGVEEAIKRFEIHPSIISIKENVKIDSRFKFSEIKVDDIRNEIKCLNPNKAGTLKNIPTKQLKEVEELVSEPLMIIWNEEIIKNKTFSNMLKCADLNPIFKKLENIFVENYRPVSVLPVVSKIFERIMQKQTNDFVESFLSPYLCGYRKRHNCQYALLNMIEKWKTSLDNKGFAGGILMDLSKAFDTINHQLLIAKFLLMVLVKMLLN